MRYLKTLAGLLLAATLVGCSGIDTRPADTSEFAATGFRYYSWRNPLDAYDMAREAAYRALEIDANLGQAYGVLANVALYKDMDWMAAETAFTSCRTLDPHYASCHQWYGSIYLVPQQRWDEAEASLQTAYAIDPISPII